MAVVALAVLLPSQRQTAEASQSAGRRHVHVTKITMAFLDLHLQSYLNKLNGVYTMPLKTYDTFIFWLS